MKLEIRNVSKAFGTKNALCDINCTLVPGIYGVLGPNGAGKSTLMNIISDNLKADSGTVLFDGADVVKLGKEFRRQLGYMTQQQHMYEGFSVLRFLYYMGALRGMKRADITERTEAVLREVNMWECRKERLGELSGGMRQRVLMAQTILNDPKVLLLDEPTAGLDPQERIRIRNLVSRISLNRIVIYSTHVVSDIEYIADTILCIREGKLIAADTPVKLCERLNGKVFLADVPPNALGGLQGRGIISNLAKGKDGFLRVRIIAGQPPEQFSYMQTAAGLEDVYLALFCDETDENLSALFFREDEKCLE